MLIKAAINGRRTASEHPKIPMNPGQQAHQAALAVSAGAGAIHVHPRDSRARESISPEDVCAALDAIRTLASDKHRFDASGKARL
jgi:uncharacterized protein (DUF849 family)